MVRPRRLHGQRRSRATLARVPSPSNPRPATVVVAALGAALVGVALSVLGIASLGSGHGAFTAGVALFLIGYGVALVVAAWGLWRLSVFGRGPVLALSLLNVAAGVGLAESAPWVWPFVAVSAVTVVVTALPATSRALHGQRGLDPLTPGDAPRPTDEPGR